MISKEETVHITKLARLELSEKEIEGMQKDLSAILDYFDILKKAPKPEKIIAETKENILREDKEKKSQISDEIIGQAPDRKDDHIRVKSIL